MDWNELHKVVLQEASFEVKALLEAGGHPDPIETGRLIANRVCARLARLQKQLEKDETEQGGGHQDDEGQDTFHVPD